MTTTTSTTAISSHTPSTARTYGAEPFVSSMQRSAAKANTVALPAVLDAQSVLEESIYSNNYTLVKKSLAYGADPNWRDLFGFSMLERATIMGNAAAVELLLDHNADVFASNRYGKTALDFAKEHAKDEHFDTDGRYNRIAEILKDRQLEPFLKELQMVEPPQSYSYELHRLIAKKKLSAALANGVDPMHSAASIVPRQLRRGINPELSMLENAIRLSDQETISYLLNCDGIDLEARNKKGQRPLDVAREVLEQHTRASLLFGSSGQKMIRQSFQVVAWLESLTK